MWLRNRRMDITLHDFPAREYRIGGPRALPRDSAHPGSRQRHARAALNAVATRFRPLSDNALPNMGHRPAGHILPAKAIVMHPDEDALRLQPLPDPPAPPLRLPAVDAGARADMSDWIAWQLLLPLLAFVLANIVLLALGGDRWIADQLYAWEGGQWALRDSFITTTVIHETGKRISIVAWLAVVAAAIVARRRPALTPWRAPLLRLALSVLLATLLVSLLKHLTHMDCPWDLQGYGGNRPYIGLFASRPSGLKASGCFPAGQASAGYAWVALYFFFLAVRPRWRWFGLGLGIAAGALFGIAQQLRGAHFLSHDLWTLMLCWSVALVLYRAGMRGRSPEGGAPA